MRLALAGILGQRRAAPNVAGGAGAQDLEMAAEVIRAGLAGLAVWWSDIRMCHASGSSPRP